MNELQRYFKERGISVKEIAQKIGYRQTFAYGILSGYYPMNDNRRALFVAAFPESEPFLDLATWTGREGRLEYLKQAIEALKTTPTDECVEWPFACAPSDGAGRVWTGEKLVKVSRLAYELYYGTPLTDCALHRCDNPKCFNPRHLYDGTKKDNRHDCLERGPSPHTAAIRERRRNGKH